MEVDCSLPPAKATIEGSDYERIDLSVAEGRGRTEVDYFSEWFTSNFLKKGTDDHCSRGMLMWSLHLWSKISFQGKSLHDYNLFVQQLFQYLYLSWQGGISIVIILCTNKST